MTERERLIKLLDNIKYHPKKTCNQFDGVCKGCRYKKGTTCNMSEREADYLVENGVIVPPVKVGDVVYKLTMRARHLFVEKTEVCRLAFDSDGMWVFCACNPISRMVFGKNVFLAREEAEKALEERRSMK